MNISYSKINNIKCSFTSNYWCSEKSYYRYNTKSISSYLFLNHLFTKSESIIHDSACVTTDNLLFSLELSSCSIRLGCS